MLKAYFMEWFVDAPGLSETEKIDLPESMRIEIPVSQFNVKETDKADISVTYQSVGLGLRQKLRKTFSKLQSP